MGIATRIPACVALLATVALGRRTALEREGFRPGLLAAAGALRPLACSGLMGPLAQQPPPQRGHAASVGGHARLPWRLAASGAKGRRPRTALHTSITPNCMYNIWPEELLSSGGSEDEVWRTRVVTDAADFHAAVKFFNLERHTEDRIIWEVGIAEQLSGLQFLRCYGWLHMGNAFAIIMELGVGDLSANVIQKPFEDFNLTARVRIFEDLVGGLQAMVERGFMHRNIKPSNLILVREGPVTHLKIADFGFTCSIPSVGTRDFELPTCEKNLTAGTSVYAAPEFRSKVWTTKGDVYAAGLILYELLFEGHQPAALAKSTALLADEEREAGTFHIQEDPTFLRAKQAAGEAGDQWLDNQLGIMERMLEVDHQQRISAEEALQQLSALSIVHEHPENPEHLAGIEGLLRQAKREAVA